MYNLGKDGSTLGVSYVMVRNVRVRVSSLFAFLVSLVCALYFTSAPIDIFPDRHNYLDYAEWRSLAYFQAIGDQPLWLFFFGEPVWHSINIALGYFLPSEVVVRAIIFVPALILYFIALQYLSAKGNYGLAFLFLVFSLYPVYISNHFHHLRFALSLSLFVMALHLKSPSLRVFLLSITPLVHISFYIFIALLGFVKITDKFENKKLVLLALVAGLATLLVVSIGVSERLAITHLERYSGRELDVGGGLFFVMFLIFIVMTSEGGEFARKHMLAFAFLGLYLASYWFFPYSRRFLDAGFWFVLIAGLSLSRVRRYAFVGVIGAVVVEFLLRTIHLPYFGYAYDWYYD